MRVQAAVTSANRPLSCCQARDRTRPRSRRNCSRPTPQGLSGRHAGGSACRTTTPPRRSRYDSGLSRKCCIRCLRLETQSSSQTSSRMSVSGDVVAPLPCEGLGVVSTLVVTPTSCRTTAEAAWLPPRSPKEYQTARANALRAQNSVDGDGRAPMPAEHWTLMAVFPPEQFEARDRMSRNRSRWHDRCVANTTERTRLQLPMHRAAVAHHRIRPDTPLDEAYLVYLAVCRRRSRSLTDFGRHCPAVHAPRPANGGGS